MDTGAEETFEGFSGARRGERLLVSPDGVALVADGRCLWQLARERIRAVLAVRHVAGGLVHDAVHLCADDGRLRRFVVGVSAVHDDYDAEYAEAAADWVAVAVRRAAGLA